jgi:peptide/nickel transport system substrate-binding protein
LLKGIGRLAGAAALAAVPLVAVAQQSGGTLVMTVEPEPPSLASYISTSQPIGQVATKVYDGLLSYDSDTMAQPALAESWEVSEDGTSITFNLRQGVTWHDGEPFTSADVQFTFMEVLKKFHPRGSNNFSVLNAVETPDEHTAIFRLDGPAPYILRILSAYESPVVPKHAFGAQDVREYDKANEPIGTGPFKFVEWRRGQFMRFDRNEDYWKDGLPYLDRIVARFIPDPGTRTAAMETGEVHLTAYSHIPTEDLGFLAEQDHLEVTEEGYEMMPGVTFLIFDTTEPPFDDVRVRQAVSYAIDRQFIIDAVWNGYPKPATGPMSSKLIWYTDDVRDYTVPDRLDIANALLDDAGYPRDEDGTRFEIVHDVQPYGEVWQRFGEVVVQQLAEVGIDVTIRYEDTPTWLNRVFTNYDFTMTSTGYFNFSDPVIGVHRGYHSNQIKQGTVFVNASRWSSPETDRIMDEAAVELDFDARKALYDEMQRLVVDAAPHVFVQEPAQISVYNTKVKGLLDSPFGSFWGMETVWIEE